MDKTFLVVVLAVAIIVILYFRTRKGSKQPTISRRQWEEYKRQQEEDEASHLPDYQLKDLGTGGLIHLSLPNGLEEDYSVIRRDRVERYDEQIEYNLMLKGADPSITTTINWWTIGIETHAWLLESIETTLEQLSLSVEKLTEIRSTRTGSLTYRNEEYTIELAGSFMVLEGGLRPTRECLRWDFRNDKDTRSIVIELRDWISPHYVIYAGRELWLRDLTIIKPRADTQPDTPADRDLSTPDIPLDTERSTPEMTTANTTTSGTDRGHLLAENGTARVTIVVARDASPSVKYAADELQQFLGEMAGAKFTITDDTGPVGAAEFIVGKNAHSESLMPKLSYDKLGKEEFIIRSVGQHLIITGGEPRGTLYGAYQLLNDLGCRWFTRDVSRIPKHDKLVAPSYEFTAEPALEYREPFFREGFDADWAAKNRVNSSHAGLTAVHGGKVQYGKGAFVHTFDPLVPVAKYFATHPEYYSLIDGKRTDDRTQLCLTNPDVLQLVIEGVRKWIQEDPEATIFSVSQNDWLNPCQCDNCRAIDEREESHSGTMLWFVNQVADAIADEAPHVAIDTLAYQYTRKPPKTLRPRPNVIVRLCSIECCFAHPLESCPENASFADDIRGWSKIADRLYIWDYVTNFRSYIFPWPNFGVLGPNVRFYADHNVVGLFEQGSYSSGGGGELAELRAYVLARLLWDPNTDQRTVENEFIEGVYGKAAKLIRRYIDLIHEPVKDPDVHMHIFCDVDNPHIVDEIIAQGDALLDEAETVAESDEVRERVEKAHLPVWYVRIRKMADDDPARASLIERFVHVAKRHGIVDIGEARPLDRWVESGAREPIHV